MDRQWMYGDRCTMAWINGLNFFLNAAEAHKSSKGFMCCPCRFCQNKKKYSKRSTLHALIYEKGFMDNYTLWTKHGESGVVMQDGEEDDDHNIADWLIYMKREPLKMNPWTMLKKWMRLEKMQQKITTRFSPYLVAIDAIATNLFRKKT